MALDLTTAEGYLNAWLAAQSQLTSNTSYTIAFPNGTSRTVTRADEQTVRNQITYWHRTVQALYAQSQGADNTRTVQPIWS